MVVRGECPPPVSPLNGRINEQRTVWRTGDRVTYTCNAGFPLSGSAQAICQANGEYSTEPPQCGGKWFENSKNTKHMGPVKNKTLFGADVQKTTVRCKNVGTESR